ncbi:MAG: hypothetical protein AABM43_09855 [Actinomycetota bacterium]
MLLELAVAPELALELVAELPELGPVANGSNSRWLAEDEPVLFAFALLAWPFLLVGLDTTGLGEGAGSEDADDAAVGGV